VAHERWIEATDREIDRLVYELYGLTEEEIAPVEGAVGWGESRVPALAGERRRR
jgi:hypothetical protein